ncbi:MAG: hypothetical protein E6J41_32820 [Chloroflexi bacterium]|nr:MAG: hypothetical protein E6J41_32820 [Chloroflexota bacterium]
MHEEEFRTRYRAAVGDAPDELGAVQRAAAVVHRAPPRPERAGAPRAMILVAGALAVLVLAGLLGPRVLRAMPRVTTPAAGGAPRDAPPAAPAVAAVAACRLPVVVGDYRAAAAGQTRDDQSTQPKYTAGFVAPATGDFVADPSAQAGSLPFSRAYVNDNWEPESYDPVLKRWLPARVRQVSPDHHSYLYFLQSPLATGKGSAFDTTSLHVYDVTTGKDRTLWTTHDQIGWDATWESDGIHASTTPGGGGRMASWVVDPVSGTVVPAAPSSPPGPSPAEAVATFSEYGMTKGGQDGTDGAGHPILLEGSRDPGAHYQYFVGGPNGRRIVIHEGTMGDAFDFDPAGFAVDGDRLWSANYDGTAIWLWTEKDGLKRYPLTGVPRHDFYVIPTVVGPCQ